MHFTGKIKLGKFLEKYKDGFYVPDYHGGFHWHIAFKTFYEVNSLYTRPKEGFGRFILNGNRIVDGYQRLMVIAMHLKAYSAISPVIFDSLYRKNCWSDQIWKEIGGPDGKFLIGNLEKWLETRLTIFELDDYDDEEAVFWNLKGKECRNPGIKEESHPYYYMETNAYWLKDFADSEDLDVKRYFRLISPEEFDRLRISSR